MSDQILGSGEGIDKVSEGSVDEAVEGLSVSEDIGESQEADVPITDTAAVPITDTSESDNPAKDDRTDDINDQSNEHSRSEPTERHRPNKSKSNKPSNIVVIGMTGCGKTTVGRLLANQMGLGFFDFDSWIVAKAGKPIIKIFVEDGEEKFRNWEKKAMSFVRNIRNHVISVGGGVLSAGENWENLKSFGTTVYVDCPIDELVRRLKNNPAELEARPLLADIVNESDEDIRKHKLTERLTVLYKQRLSMYTQADVTVTEVFSTPESSVKKLRELIKTVKKR